MKRYIDTETGEYPLLDSDIKQRHSNVSFPHPFQPLQVYQEVHPIERPVVDYTKTISEAVPEVVDGLYFQRWEVSDATEEVIADRTADEASIVRGKRQQLLEDSDWTQLPDAAEAAVDVTAWTEYRRQLRDISEQPGFPWDVQWPTEPV